MKHALVTITGLALLLAAPATARTVPPSSPVQIPTTITDLDVRLDNAWADLNAKWMAGTISDREYQLVTDLLIQVTEASKTIYPEAGTLRYRLQAAIDDLKAKAVKSAKNAQVVDAVWEQLVDMRLNRALAPIKAKLLANNATRDDWLAATTQLVKRASAAKDDAEADTVRARLQGMLDELQKKAMTAALTAADFQPYEKELAEERLVRVVTWVKVDSLGKTFTHFDFVRVSDVLRDRGTIDATAANILKAYQDSVDRLERAAGNDTLTLDQFNKFMAEINVRVRGALK